jgi:uncharacterized protein involved in exopolysaccharide biosynthesis
MSETGVEIGREDFGKSGSKRMTALILRRGVLVIGAVVTGATIALAASFALPRVYAVQALLIPASTSDGEQGLAAMANRLDTLTTLAGVSFRGKDSADEAIALLTSRAFTEEFIEEENLLPRLFYRQWDGSSHSWKRSYFLRTPTLWRAYRKFNERIRTVTQDRRSGLVAIRIDWIDPEEGAHWANSLVARVNERMRQRSIQEADQMIKQLQDELSRTDVVELRAAMFRLIENQVKQRALARVRSQYAFRIIDPAAPGDLSDPARPLRSVLTLLGAVVGLLIGCAYVAWPEIRERLRRQMVGPTERRV